MGNDRCRWVRHRLPLLAGGELEGTERRRVDRHLIGCPDCRDRRDASEGVLAILRASAPESPARPDAPSLWPALARQIRESRHAAPRPSWLDPIRSQFPSGFWPAMGLAMGLGGVMAVALPRDHQPPAAAPIVPTAPAPIVVVVPEPADRPTLGPAPAPEPRRPATTLTQGGANPFESPSGLRLNYDLDHGTPVGPGGRDPQHSY